MVTTIIILLVGAGGFFLMKKLIDKKNADNPFPKSQVKEQRGVITSSGPAEPVEEKPEPKPRKVKK